MPFPIPTWIFIVLVILLIIVLGYAGIRLLFSGRRKLKEYCVQGLNLYSDLGETRYRPEYRTTKGSVLVNRELGLCGKPDRIQMTTSGIVVWEFKSGKTPPEPYHSHILQLTAYAMLVEKEYNTIVHRGYIRYPERTFEVDISEQLRREVMEKIRRMREVMRNGSPRRNHNSPRRCARCVYRDVCKYKL